MQVCVSVSFVCAGDMGQLWWRVVDLCGLIAILSAARGVDDSIERMRKDGSRLGGMEQLDEIESPHAQWSGNQESEQPLPRATEPSQVSSVYFHNISKRFEGGYLPTGNYTWEEGEVGEGTDVSVLGDNCMHPRQSHEPRYNDSCAFVHGECEDQSELFDYLAFVLCDLPKAQVSRKEGRKDGEGVREYGRE